MSPVTLLNMLPLTLAIAFATAQDATLSTFPAVPLASKTIAYTAIPYKVDTDTGLIRGQQLGYNQCNSTTENQDSLCQTSIFNGIDDFCLWAPSVANKSVGEAEGDMVAWCSKPGHGTRLIPDGLLTGLQFLKTPDYIQVVGFMSDQTLLDLALGDYGGEMDPHGADLRGNPMGGIMYSTNFTGSYTQVIEWTNFIGGNAFCLKACDPAGPHPAENCQHIYDRIGCAYNAPNAAKDGVFESCQADSADFPGVYTSNGVVQTYVQPPESLGPIVSIPFTARVPSSSNCVTHSSAALFAGLPTGTGAASITGGVTGTGTGVTSKPTGKSGTSSSGKPSATSTGNATALAVSGFSTIFGVVFAALFLS